MYRTARKLQYAHFVILGPAIGRRECLDLEGMLQDRAKDNPVTYAKYDPSVRDRAHSRSSGGSELHDHYFIYMTWR